MIIQCEKCNTKYNFDESLIEGKGVRVRCTRCQNVFFQENPSAGIPPIDDVVEPEQAPTEPEQTPTEPEQAPVEEKKGVEDLAKTLKELGVETDDHAPDRWEAETFDTVDEENEFGDISPNSKVKKKKKRILSRVIVYLLLFILLGGVYAWFFPKERQAFFDTIKAYVPIEKLLDMKKGKKDVEVIKEAINFTEVKERVVKNWIIGDILIIEGTAVNNNKFNVSAILVKGKILDKAGTTLAEKASYCNNILTDEELRNLTEKEIYRELDNPTGRNLANANIPYQGKAPFMIVFTNPSKEAGEFIVELADIKTVDQ